MMAIQTFHNCVIDPKFMFDVFQGWSSFPSFPSEFCGVVVQMFESKGVFFSLAPQCRLKLVIKLECMMDAFVSSKV